MRQIDTKTSQQRKEKILQAVIHHYIKTGKPVGSSVLTDEYGIELSSATIRSVMSELENEGYLSHPHTSAGRVPSDKGYRNYVDSMIEMQKLVLEEEGRIRKEYEERSRELQEILAQTSKILSTVSHFTGFVLTPKIGNSRVEHIELVPLDENRILLIMVTSNGFVKHKIIEANLSRNKVEELSRMLSSELKGSSVNEAKIRIISQVEQMQRMEQESIRIMNFIGSGLFDSEEDIYMEGASNALNMPEFSDLEPMRGLLKLSEEKDILMHVMDNDLDREGVRVLIGGESLCKELKELSVVSSVYKNKGTPVGILGIIGPKRMEYPKMMALVGAVSKIVNKILNKTGE